MANKPKKQFSYEWVFEAFGNDPSFYQKRMFGGLAAYFNGLMVMLLTESPGEKEYRGKKHNIDLWDGVLLPTERDMHESLLKDFKSLSNHPVLGKWLYLPATKEDFEETANSIAELISEGDLRFGIEPSMKSKKKSNRKA